MCEAKRVTNAADAEHGVHTGILADLQVGLPLFANKEEPYNACIFSVDQNLGGTKVADCPYPSVTFLIKTICSGVHPFDKREYA